jgi:L-threonylcarbamoyladenylate synthase
MAGVSQRFSLLDPDEAARGITAAVAAIRAGDLVVMPTDTVYGLAADPFSNPAVDRLLRAKDRGRETPPPVLVGSVAALQGLADEVDDRVDQLVERFWPGGLSLILRVQPTVNWDLGETRETVMLRMPDHDQALQLLRRTGPLAVSSANRHGRPPATSVEHAEAELGDRVEVYLDGGPTPGDVPSTILDLTRITPQLLRRGVVTDEMLRELIPSMEVDIDGEPMPGEELLAEWEAEQARLDAEEAEAEAERERKRAAGEFVEEDEEIPFEPWPEGEGPDSVQADVEEDEPTGPVEYVELAERTGNGERTEAGEAEPVDDGADAQEWQTGTEPAESPGGGGERADRVDEVPPRGTQPAGERSEPEFAAAQAEGEVPTDAATDPVLVEPPGAPDPAEAAETTQTPIALADPKPAGATVPDDTRGEPGADSDVGQSDPVRDRSRQQD